MYILCRSNLLTNISLLIESYGITIVTSFGILLNIIGLAFLIAERRDKMFNLLLSTLLIFDTLFLGFNLIKSVGTHFVIIPTKYLKLYSFIVYPGSRFNHISSVYMTIALSHSRFEAVNKPIQHRSILKSKSDRLKYLLRYTIPILSSSLVLTIPCFWEYDINSNGSIANGTVAELIPSKFRQNPYYSIFYVGILGVGLLGVLPFALLVYYTVKISKAIARNSLTLGNLSSAQKKEIKIFNQKHNHTLVVNLIVVFFLVFHSLRLGLTIVEFIIQCYTLNNRASIHDMARSVTPWLNVFSSISELLLMLNSSVNTLIYKGVDGFCKARSCKTRTNSYSTTADTDANKKILPISRKREKLISRNLTIPNRIENSASLETPTRENSRAGKRRFTFDVEESFEIIKERKEFV